MELLIEGCRLLGIPLTEEQVDLFRVYTAELLDWNRRFNLTSITDPAEIQTRHFLDSLTCFLAFPGVAVSSHAPLLRELPSFVGLQVIDVGAGAGFPGLPLKIVRPEMELTLLDSVGKKTRFLSHLVAGLGLPGVQVLTGRAEELARDEVHRGRYDVVVSRAVADIAVLAELCLPLARIGGRLIAPKKAGACKGGVSTGGLSKGGVSEEVGQAAEAIRVLGGKWLANVAVDLPGLLDLRYLVVVEKSRPTPPSYPRRPGMPAKKPLGR